MGTAAKKTIVVDGDVTLDWSLARGDDPAKPSVSASAQNGGAALLGRLVRQIAEDLQIDPQSTIATPGEPEPNGTGKTSEAEPNRTWGKGVPNRFSIWKRYPEDESHVWRVETELGVQAARGKPADKPSTDPERADLVVLHDADLGFRDDEERWPRVIREMGPEPPWVVLRMSEPVAKGRLWERLKQFGERLIVVIHIDDLRLGTLHITRGLSWERTAQDALYELRYHPEASELRESAHVVASFTTAGALVFSPRETGKKSCQLVFDTAAMERTWNEDHPGGMIGGVTALTASVAREVLLNTEDPDVVRAAQHGIKAMRNLDLEGYQREEGEQSSGEPGIEFPVARIAETLAEESRPCAEAPVCDPSQSRSRLAEERDRRRAWMILEEHHPGDLEKLATKIVEQGHTQALPEVPKGEFGDLLAFDRHEIEGLQSIRLLIDQYASRKSPETPLSIAVFGPPGCGKSWSVEQVAKAVLEKDVEPKSFNLSQFDDPHELIEALHQVRDASLGGKLPLVLWDEFDMNRLAGGEKQELGWLAHFLSPMADGKFQDGQITHPIGRAVFVFAGGRFERMDKFAAAAKDEEYRAAKAPDFLSRLSGYVNVAGPNPRGSVNDDRYFLIRRAVMIRSMLHRFWEDVFQEADPSGKPDVDSQEADRPKKPNIDKGVLQALLLTREYRHGVRSLESIITTSAVPGQTRFERSDLPPEPQLDLHVVARDFLGLVHLPGQLQTDQIDRLAKRMHEHHRDKWGKEGDSDDPEPVTYDELGDADKEDWRRKLREIPADVVNADCLTHLLDDDELVADPDQLVPLRTSLEAAVAERAALDGRPEYLTEAREAVAEMEDRLTAPAEFHEADVRFHLALAAASGNEAMRLLMRGFRESIAAHLEQTPAKHADVVLENRLGEHKKILKAIEEREAERAGDLIRWHLDESYRQRPGAAQSRIAA